MPNAFVVRTSNREVPGFVIPGVFKSLRAGRARIGWSYRDDLDLRQITERARRGEWNALTKELQDAWYCHGFLDRVGLNDYLLYPHQDKYGKFCIVQVTGAYEYSPESESVDGDFRSFRTCRMLTDEAIDWYDEIVPPTIRARLGLPRRFYQITDHPLFERLLDVLPQAGKIESGPDIAYRRIQTVLGEMRDAVAEQVQRAFPRHDLSRLFCEELFTRMGYQCEVLEGAGDRGSDLVVTISDELLPREFVVGVQVASYSGEVSVDELRKKVEQLENGWDVNHLNFGVILTTGICGEAGFRFIQEHNAANPNRLLRLIDARVLGALVLRVFDSGDCE